MIVEGLLHRIGKTRLARQREQVHGEIHPTDCDAVLIRQQVGRDGGLGAARVVPELADAAVPGDANLPVVDHLPVLRGGREESRILYDPVELEDPPIADQRLSGLETSDRGKGKRLALRQADELEGACLPLLNDVVAEIEVELL